jgi:hypothetical protein
MDSHGRGKPMPCFSRTDAAWRGIDIVLDWPFGNVIQKRIVVGSFDCIWADADVTNPFNSVIPTTNKPATIATIAAIVLHAILWKIF